MLGLTGFEDRGAHQDTYASVAKAYTEEPRSSKTGRPSVSVWQGRFLASATMIVFLNVMKTTRPFGEFPLSRVPGQ